MSLSDEVPAMEANQGIWFVHINGEPRGPFSADALRQALAHGTVSDQDWIWREGLSNWISIQELTQFDPPKASTPTRWQKMRRHLGSTLALILGCLYFLSGINAASRAEHTEGLVGGPIVILGAIAYSSAKKRKLGEVKSSLTRKCFEVVILLLICFLAFARNDVTEAMYTHPVQNLFVPLWALLAYLIITLAPRRWLGSGKSFEMR